MNLVLLVLLGGLMHATRSFSESQAATTAGVSLSFGYLMLTAFFAGQVFRTLRLPRLTGYLVSGLVVGPGVLGLISPAVVEQLKLVNGVAIALIALNAGSELNLREMKPMMRTISWITLVAVIGAALLLAVSAYFARDWLPFMESMSRRQAAAIALVLGVVMAAQSPAVVVALRDEMRAQGPITQTVLGVVVLADLVVILLFAATSTVAKFAMGVEGTVGSTMAHLAWEIFGSVGAGVVIGAVLAAYLHWVKSGRALFTVAATFVLAEVGQRLGLDPLLTALTSGLVIRNFTKLQPRLHKGIEAASLPIYVVFFGVAGTAIHLDVLLVVGAPAVLFVVVRGFALVIGSNVGSRLAGAPESVRKYAGFGLLPQAGLALALSILFARTFPEFGSDAGALTLGVVAMNELLAPILYKIALVRSGEAGARQDEKPGFPPLTDETALPEKA